MVSHPQILLTRRKFHHRKQIRIIWPHRHRRIAQLIIRRITKWLNLINIAIKIKPITFIWWWKIIGVLAKEFYLNRPTIDCNTTSIFIHLILESFWKCPACIFTRLRQSKRKAHIYSWSFRAGFMGFRRRVILGMQVLA